MASSQQTLCLSDDYVFPKHSDLSYEELLTLDLGLDLPEMLCFANEVEAPDDPVTPCSVVVTILWAMMARLTFLLSVSVLRVWKFALEVSMIAVRVWEQAPSGGQRINSNGLSQKAYFSR